jgi:hypothetical protein
MPLAELEARIIHILIDDEEFVEEIYLGVNFCAEEDLVTSRRPILRYRAYRIRYRLADIAAALDALATQGLVVSRAVAGFAPVCGSLAWMFSLTEAGRQHWQTHVRDNVAQYFGEPL